MQPETEQFVSQNQQHASAQSSTRQGLLFVLSAPSGTGKDTVISALKQQGMNFYVVPSVTTRSPRSGESEGNPYHFVDQETFERMVSQGELLEYANVHGNWYGQSGTKERNLAMELVRVTEAAALSAGRWMGKGDKIAVDQAAVNAMRLALDGVDMHGVVVIGEGEKDEAPMLFIGEEVGNGTPPNLDVAVDPVDGTRLASLGLPGAIAVVATAE